MRPHLPACVCAAALLVLVGCSSSSTSDPGRVAQLPSSTTTRSQQTTTRPDGGATGTPTAAVTHRPRSKLFETDQERQANLVPYANCMRARHVPVDANGKPLDVNSNATLQAAAAADRACDDTKPLPPIEDDASNPKALIFNRAVAACLRAHGVSPVYVQTSDGYVSIAFGDGAATLGLRYSDQCTHQVAAHGH